MPVFGIPCMYAYQNVHMRERLHLTFLFLEFAARKESIFSRLAYSNNSLYISGSCIIYTNSQFVQVFKVFQRQDQNPQNLEL